MPGNQQQKASNNSGKEKTLTDDFLDVLNPNTMLNNAQRVLSSAVNVLEEEIAAGILAAKKIEKKVIDVEDVRNNPENLLNRIRKDTHEVVDLFLDAAIALSSQLKILSDNVAKQTENIKQPVPSREKKQRHEVAVLHHDEPLLPGETATLYMQVNDEDASQPIKIQLQKNDLTGPFKQKIAANNISIKPSSFTLKPAATREVEIRVKIPANCKKGHYTCLFTDVQNPLIRAIISVEVV